MAILVLNDDAVSAAREVVAYAEAHRFPESRLRELMDTGEPIAQDPLFSCEIPVGFHCSFTIEQHPGGWARHLSVSVRNKTKTASPEALTELMRLFGFRAGLEKVDGLWLENTGARKAVNIVQRYDIE